MTIIVLSSLALSCHSDAQKIDRRALVERNSPVVTEFEELSSLTVGNGNFCFTVDATGLQTFPELYAKGVPLGTMSSWGWHSFPNVNNFKHEETLKNYPYHNAAELYSVQFNEGRQKDAANYFRENPHRLHLGYVGFEGLNLLSFENLTGLEQKLDLWNGKITSSFDIADNHYDVSTAVNPNFDRIGAHIKSTKGNIAINFRFPFPTKGHSDDASDWTKPNLHKTEIVSQNENSFTLKRTVDTTIYYVSVVCTGKAKLTEKEPHYFVLSSEEKDFEFVTTYQTVIAANAAIPSQQGNQGIAGQARNDTAEQTFAAASSYWQSFWTNGAAVDFSKCTDPRAGELERRVVLSQYLMAINSAGIYPPQESGLTYNTWYGKPHLEMHWWHAAWLPLWNHSDLLERSMDWYKTAEPVAREIAERQGFKGVRWMKMTDPQAMEAPSKVGSFLIWQQPHYIYFAEELYRNNPTPETLAKYYDLVMKSAEFMASFATYDELDQRYVLKGIIAAQETTRASETINPPFEVSYWHFALNVAQKWRERNGEKRRPQWDEIIDKLSPLAYNEDGLYLASENATDTYKDIRYTSDHPAVLGSVGILPLNKLIRADYMKNTLNWIWENWNWGKTWGWDFPMTAMCAARIGEPQRAVDALLMDKRTNTYLINGHNYQDSRLRVYLPGNGGLLTAVAMMCAGWDGSEGKNPGFPKDGKWNVQWEGLKKMP
ncbi:MAG: hypothetical protein LBN23_02145 [Paludibacter sp.]|nr:hypothetical protein [Paludibacter sp.]